LNGELWPMGPNLEIAPHSSSTIQKDQNHAKCELFYKLPIEDGCEYQSKQCMNSLSGILAPKCHLNSLINKNKNKYTLLKITPNAFIAFIIIFFLQ
jgi:hypothetical protein